MSPGEKLAVILAAIVVLGYVCIGWWRLWRDRV